MSKSYPDLIGALRTSVLETVAATAPDEVEAALAKSFGEFEDALHQQLSEDMLPAPGDTDPLSFFGMHLEALEKGVALIEGGECMPLAGMQPGDTSINLMKAVLDLGDLALRAAASDFAAPIMAGEDTGDGESLVKVATSDGEALVKTVLPLEMKDLLISPIDLGAEIASFGAQLLAFAGVSPEQLAKAAPPFKRKPRGGEDEEAEGDEGADEGEEGDGEGDEGAEYAEGDEGADEGEFPEGMEGGEGAADEGTPLENIAKLATGILIELDSLSEMAGAAGDMAEGADGNPIMGAVEGMQKMAALLVVQADALQSAADSDGPEADAYAEKAEKAGDLLKMAAASLPLISEAHAELAKRATEQATTIDDLKASIEDLRKATAESSAALRSQIETLAASPAAPRGATRAVPGAGTVLGKSADNAADEGDALNLDAAAADLAKRDPEAARRFVMKAALAHPLGAG